MDEKVQKVLKQLSDTEKAALVSGKNMWFTAALISQKIDAIMMTDGPAGLRKQTPQTGESLSVNDSVQAISYPAAALVASTFNRELARELGQHLGDEAQSEGISLLLGPGVNIKRSPLGGRNFEYYSEDPLVAGEMGVAYINGLHDRGVGATVKHFAANNRENHRFTNSSEIDERTLREIYLAPFERIVKNAHPEAVMASYNKLNGVQNVANHRLLTEILRDEWGFKGVVMSDWMAVADHVASLNAGLDLEMPGKGDPSTAEILAALQNDKVSPEQLDLAAGRVLSMVMTLLSQQQSDATYDRAAHHQFARKLAADGMVLLKNAQDVLPLAPTDSLAFIGAMADQPRYQGAGSSHVAPDHVVSALAAAKTADLKVQYAPGYSLENSDVDTSLQAAAVKLARQADTVVVFVGYRDQDESEGFDKAAISLPDNQTSLIQALSRAVKKLIVVLANGSVVEMPWRNQVTAILETYLAGEGVGEATIDILTGAVNPSGRLAETFPVRLADTPSFGTFDRNDDIENYHEGIFVGYRYYDLHQQNVAFPFGFGISYTTFEYKNLNISDWDEDTLNVSFTIKNTGARTGAEVPQLYLSNLASPIEKPVRELRQFDKVSLAPNEEKTITLALHTRDFSWYNADQHVWEADNGNYDITIGASSRDLRLTHRISIDRFANKPLVVTFDTYLNVLLANEKTKAILMQMFGDQLNQYTSQDSASTADMEMLFNTPLRALVAGGFPEAVIQSFIDQANAVLAE